MRQRARVSLRWPFGRGGQRHGHLRLLLLSPHNLQVRAKDAAGHALAQPRIWTFTVTKR